EFEGENGLRLWRLSRQMAEQVGQQFVNGRQRRVGLRGLFDERGAIAGLLKTSKLFTQTRVRFVQDDFAQCVQFGAAAAREAEVGQVKKVEFAAKGGGGPARGSGDGGAGFKVRRQPGEVDSA